MTKIQIKQIREATQKQNHEECIAGTVGGLVRMYMGNGRYERCALIELIEHVRQLVRLLKKSNDISHEVEQAADDELELHSSEPYSNIDGWDIKTGFPERLFELAWGKQSWRNNAQKTSLK